MKNFFKSFLEVKTGEESCREGFGVFGGVAGLDLALCVLLLLFPAKTFLDLVGGSSGVAGMAIGVEGRSSWTQEGLLGVAGEEDCFSNHQVILFFTSGWPLLLAVNLILLGFLGQSDELCATIGVPGTLSSTKEGVVGWQILLELTFLSSLCFFRLCDSKVSADLLGNPVRLSDFSLSQILATAPFPPSDSKASLDQAP